ncbi:MAG: DUF1127 domain-containing protein [Pseudomonadota bacterium]
MAHYVASRPVVATPGIGARLQKLFAGFVGFIADWNEARITRNELAKLSDHQLEDLGLTRGDIDGLYR